MCDQPPDCQKAPTSAASPLGKSGWRHRSFLVWPGGEVVKPRPRPAVSGEVDCIYSRLTLVGSRRAIDLSRNAGWCRCGLLDTGQTQVGYPFCFCSGLANQSPLSVLNLSGEAGRSYSIDPEMRNGADVAFLIPGRVGMVTHSASARAFRTEVPHAFYLRPSFPRKSLERR